MSESHPLGIWLSQPGRHIRVDGVPVFINIINEDSPTSDMGATNVNRCKLWVDISYPEASVADTIIHELIHQIIQRRRLHKRLKLEQEEEVCWTLAAGLFEIMVNDPDIFSALLNAAERAKCPLQQI